jgi:glycosyltransferase involved in cell wall biosynthesis
MRPPTEEPACSVIIPAYNAAAYVEQAIRSALDQRGVSVEVIVIDDGSTDTTPQVLAGFGDAIRVVQQQRGGPYRARNLGAKLARGQWLAFLDADDEWLPDKLARQLARVDEQTGLVYSDVLNFGDCDRVKERLSDSVPLQEGDVFEPLLLGNFIALSSVVMRRDWFERLGGFSESQQGVQDWDLWLRYAGEGGRVKVCREPLTRYRLHDGQMSNDVGRRTAERMDVIRRALKSLRGRMVSRGVARRAYAATLEISAWRTAPFQRWRAIGWYLRSASWWPWRLSPYKGILKCLLGRA